MTHLLLIAAGGASGALCRYWLSNWINSFSHGKIPIATLSVNIIGSFIIGIMFVLITEKVALHSDWRNIAIIGFLGAFTTFSTFSLEAVTLLANGQLSQAAIYISSSLVLCLLATWVAITFTRLI